MNVRQPIHFVVVVVVVVVFFVLFLFFFFTNLNIYHLATFLTTLDSFAIAVHRAHVKWYSLLMVQDDTLFSFSTLS